MSVQPHFATDERNQSLWLLVVSPATWAAHFLISYVTAAIWCAKAPSSDAPLGWVRVAIVAYTVVALVLIGVNGSSGLRRYRHGNGESTRHDDTPADRHRFLGFATLLLAGLSFVSTVFVALVVFFFEDCR